MFILKLKGFADIKVLFFFTPFDEKPFYSP